MNQQPNHTVRSTQVLDGWTLALCEGDDEPKVGAFEVGSRAGLSRARDIKKLVDRNREELEKHGPIPMRATVARIGKTGAIKGFELREVEEPLLNEAQAINLVALMRTERASDLRVALVKVFVAFRREQFQAKSEPPQLTACIGDSEAAKVKFRRAVQHVIAMREDQVSWQKVYGVVRSRFKVNSPWAIAMLLLDRVLEELQFLEKDPLDTNGRIYKRRTDRQPKVDKRQLALNIN
jgi:hypothetical protein